MIKLVNRFLKKSMYAEQEYRVNYSNILKNKDVLALKVFFNKQEEIDKNSVNRAFQSSSPEIMALLIKELDAQIFKMDLGVLFKYVATSGSIEVAKMFIPYVDKLKDSEKSWILTCVSDHGQTQMFKYLVDDVGYLKAITTTTLESAVVAENKELVDFILLRNPTISLKEAIISASYGGYFRMVKQLIGYGGSIALAFKYARDDIRQDLEIYIKMLKEKELLTTQNVDIKESVKNKGFKV